ncbi:twin-arginine translocation signal domain-containing protein [Salipiger thiooxidans]|uniref:twin-arginine translocation signal domain-containing protein n=1 Tax=Salipiger thiooxidans TaxID=282683 RepID=UPI001F6146B5|nr:twin-arginine translocation signal domain-containing protein [Salipiger thiooxidans]
MTDLPGYPSRRSFLKASAAGVAFTGLAASAQAQESTPPRSPRRLRPRLSECRRMGLRDGRDRTTHPLGWRWPRRHRDPRARLHRPAAGR